MTPMNQKLRELLEEFHDSGHDDHIRHNCNRSIDNTLQAIQELYSPVVKALKKADSMIAHAGCIQGCVGGAIQTGEDECVQCQWCDERHQITEALKAIGEME